MGDDADKVLGDVEVLYADNHILVLDKPAGLLTQSAAAGDDNLLDRAKDYIKGRFSKPGNVYLGLIHRLDRNVSGVVVLARTSKAAGRLSKAFRDRDVVKEYLAVVDGETPEQGELRHVLMNNPSGRGVIQSRSGKNGHLRYSRVETNGQRSLLAVELLTGRKHQIRAQLAWSGYPITGDPLYGLARPGELGRPALHAARLSLRHPVRGEDMVVGSETQGEFNGVFEG
jgi:23S rRNA pseudouridine1911/1915/1917 synthase